MDRLRGALVVALAGALACSDDSGGGDTDTDPTAPPTIGGPEGSDTFDPPDTFPDTFDADSDPTDDPSSPTFTTSDPTDDSSSPTSTSSDPQGTTTTAADTDVATGSEADTDTDTDGSTTDPTGELPDAGMCCQSQDRAPGCDDAAVTDCVCAQDPYCCDDTWDEICVVAVVIHGCGICEGVGGGGDCCAANDTPGCDDDVIEACVCEADSVCCLQPWDETCAMGVEFEGCGRCP